MADRNQEALRRCWSAPARASRPRRIRRWKVGNMYAVLMDSARAEREGLTPLRADLARIDAIQTRADLQSRDRRLRTARLRPRRCASGRSRIPTQQHAARSRSCSRPGSACRTATTTSRPTPSPTRLRREYVALMTRMFVLAGADADAGRGRRQGGDGARDRARGLVDDPRRAAATRRRSTTRSRWRELAALAPASTGRSTSARPASPRWPTRPRRSTSRCRSSSARLDERWSTARRSRPGAPISRGTCCAPRRRGSTRSSSTQSFAFQPSC